MVSIDRLKEYDFFREFTDEELAKVAVFAEEKSCSAGTQVYKTGDPASYLYLIQQGKVLLVMDSSLGPHKPSFQVTVDFCTKGEPMGWSGVVEPYVYTLAALCMDDTKLIAIDGVKLRLLLSEDCTLGFKLMTAIAKLIALRLNHIRTLLVSERGLSHLTEY